MMKVRSRILAAASLCLLYLNAGSVAMAGTLLPNGMQYFTDNNGLPVSAGCVYFYTPGTLAPKATYLDSGQTVANSNPVQLDAAGRAIIYGTGTYRQIVKAAGPIGGSPCSPAGVQIWDQITASTDSSATIFAGTSSGTPNAITVTAPAFTGSDGQVINYISTNTNTGSATFNASGFGAVLIVRDSATGPQALTGGELVATNAVSLIYDATGGTFHILSPVTWPTSGGVPVGTIIPVGGFAAPLNYAFAYGQAVSRATYATLFASYTSAQSGTISSGSPTITGLSDTSQFGRGQFVEATGVSAGTTIQSCTSTTCTMSGNASLSRTGTITVFAYGNGDGTTTFNLPDLRGRTLVARDNMGGSAGNVSQVTTTLTTTASSPTATVGSAASLSVGMTVSGNANVAPGTTISAISGTTITLSGNASGSQSNVSTRFSVFPDAQGLGLPGGVQSKALALGELPTGITSSGTASVSPNGVSSAWAMPASNFLSSPAFGPDSYGGGVNSPLIKGNVANTIFVATTMTGTSSTTSSNTSGNPHTIIQPSAVVNYAVRLTP